MGRILLASNETSAMAPSLERDGFETNGTRSTTNPSLRSTGNFNPALAVVVSTMIISFFFVGFATGYLRRWILGPEDANLRRRISSNRPTKATEGGLDPEVVSALPLVLYADLLAAGKPSEDCPVCLAVFEATDSLRLLPQCAHLFHSECIDEWFKSHTTCPLCRACLATSDAEGADTEDRDAEGDEEHGGIQRPADYDFVQVVIDVESSASAAALSGLSQEAPTGEENSEQHEEEAQENSPPIPRDAASFIRAIRIGTSPAAKPCIRRSSSVGTGLQLRSYVVDSEGTQHSRISSQVHAIAVDDEQINGASTLSLGVLKGGAGGLQRVWATRWSFPNLTQIAPP